MFDYSQKNIRIDFRRRVATIIDWKLWPMCDENRIENRGHWDIQWEGGRLIKQGGIRKFDDG